MLGNETAIHSPNVKDTASASPSNGVGASIAAAEQHIAARICERRALLGMSQSALGAELGVTRQQVQKYEAARDHISAGVLHEIAQLLGVDVAYFFDGLDQDGSTGDGCRPVREPKVLRFAREMSALREEHLTILHRLLLSLRNAERGAGMR